MVIVNFLAPEPFVLTAVHVGTITKCSYKPLTRQMLLSVLPLFVSTSWTSVIPVNRALRIDYSAHFGLQVTFLAGDKNNRIQRLN